MAHIDVRSINITRRCVRGGQWRFLHIVLDVASANRALVLTLKYISGVLSARGASRNAFSIVIHIAYNWSTIR